MFQFSLWLNRLARPRRWCLVMAILWSANPAPMAAQVSVLQPPANSTAKKKSDSLKKAESAEAQLNRLVTALARQSIPHTYVEDKDWNQQADRWDGIRLRREGLRIETKRKKKRVNHGTWKKYSASLVDPKKQFHIEVNNLKGEKGKLYFDISVRAAVSLHGRQSKWVKGVQLYSLSADANAKLNLVVSCEIDIDLNLKKLPPDITLSPKITSAKIHIQEFKVERVSKAGGELAQQLAKAVRKKLDGKIAEKEQKLVEKLNREIDRKRGDLTFSFDKTKDSELAKKARPFLGPPIQKALEAYRKRP